MNNNVVIKVENLSKKFCRDFRSGMIYSGLDLVHDLFFNADPRQAKLRKNEFWALNDVNFEIQKGQSVAFLGTNGSGKSTLLRVLAGIFPPDQGSVAVRGQVGALIALGAGFHPNMTGRENIYLNSALMGLRKWQIDQRYNEIVDFADIGDFIDAPVATYSSGMSVRLGFSVAVHSDAEILLIDEVLAVGDLPFALKCYRKMSEFSERGGTSVLVTHNNQVVRNFCNHAVWLDKGRIVTSGNVKEIADQYELAVTKNEVESNSGRTLHYDNQAKITSIEVLGRNGPQSEFSAQDEMTVRIHYQADRTVKVPIFSVTLESVENFVVVCNFSSLDGYSISEISGIGFMDFKIQKLFLKLGRYMCSATFCEGNPSNNLSWLSRATNFSITVGSAGQGICDPNPLWRLEGKSS